MAAKPRDLNSQISTLKSQCSHPWYNKAKGVVPMKDTGISERVLQEIRKLAEQYHVKRVVLFGSRARGDFHRTSDIDLAVSGGDIVSFALDVEDKTWTLLKYDVVNMDQPVQKELKESIEKEGVLLYEEGR